LLSGDALTEPVIGLAVEVKEIKLLSDGDRAVIEGLKPWARGHPHLFDLHTLDIVWKHRQLLGVYVMPVGASVAPVDGQVGCRFGLKLTHLGLI
jgi:hypothetical protein